MPTDGKEQESDEFLSQDHRVKRHVVRLCRERQEQYLLSIAAGELLTGASHPASTEPSCVARRLPETAHAQLTGPLRPLPSQAKRASRGRKVKGTEGGRTCGRKKTKRKGFGGTRKEKGILKERKRMKESGE